MKRGESTIEILRERERLLALCAAQRDDLALLVGRLDGVFRVADRGIAGARYLRDRPLVLGAIVAALAVMRRRGLLQWAQRGFVVWRAYRTFAKTGFKFTV